MACCGGGRSQFRQSTGQSARGSLRGGGAVGVMSAAREMYRSDAARTQGTRFEQSAIKATPYRRPPERTQ